jgi:hypothetical protein
MATCANALFDAGTTAGAWQSWNNYYGGTTVVNQATSIWPQWNYQYVTMGSQTTDVFVSGMADQVTNGVWGTWNTIYYQGTNIVPQNWIYWNQHYTLGSTQAIHVVEGYQEQVWSAWNEEYVPKAVMAANPILAKEPDAEQRAKLDEAKRIREQQARDAEAKRVAAKKRAQQLLKSTLSRRQQEDFDKSGSFELEVGHKLYRVIPGQRVQRLNRQTKKVERYFCIHTAYDHPVPPEDTALAQKLLLEADEAQFLKIANESAA